MDERHAISELGMRCGYRISPAERLLQLEYISTKGFDKDRGHLLIPPRARTREPDKKEKKKTRTTKQKRANTSSYSQHACHIPYW